MRIASVGDNCVDVYRQEEFVGGNSVNVAVHAARLKIRASYVGAVGDDHYGAVILNQIAAQGVDTSHVKTLPGNSAVTQVELVNGERVFGDYDPGVTASFKLDEEDIDFLAGHDIVVSALWGMVEDDLWRIKARGTAIAFDFATKLDDPVIDKAIPHVDYAFFAYDGEEEDFIRNYMKTIHARGPKQVITTRGDRGSIAYDGKHFFTFGIVPCQVVDTMGAGDSYIAAYLKGVISGCSIAECMAQGAENSSKTITYKGAW
jgi:fructoselysine 6-kinase